jgi:acyl-CoA thioester hydrolase
VRIEFRMTSDGDGRLLAEGWGALVGYDYTAGRACPLPATLTGPLRAQIGPEADAAEPRRTV